MTATAYVQGTDAWLAARRDLVTASDIPVLLGLSPYKCEADLADDKLFGDMQPQTLRMRIGLAVQDLIGEAYSESTGRRVKRDLRLHTHPGIPWAGASPDFRVIGERRLVEAKRTSSRSRFADGLPQDIEAQVAWQLGVTGYPVADVAALVADDELEVFEVAADPALFDDLVAVAVDFRRRLLEGGPFARDSARIRRDHPSDDGSELTADAELTEAVTALVALRAQRKDMEAAEERIETAIKARMGDAARLTGPGFAITWKQTRDVGKTDWKSIADGLLRQMPETERAALVGLHTSITPGFRPFRVTLEKE